VLAVRIASPEDAGSGERVRISGTVRCERGEARSRDLGLEPGAALWDRMEPMPADRRALTSLDRVMVQAGPNLPVRATLGPDGAWAVELARPPGPVVVRAWAIDVGGRRSREDSLLFGQTAAAEDAAVPVVEIVDPPIDESPDRVRTHRGEILLRGTTSDDRAVERMEAWRDGVLLSQVRCDTEDYFATWACRVPLQPGRLNRIEILACDAVGRCGSDAGRIAARRQVDRAPPAVSVRAPRPGARVDAAEFEVRGTASDLQGIRAIEVRVGWQDASGSLQWGPPRLASSDDGFVSWRAVVAGGAGAAVLEVRAIDESGLSSVVQVGFTGGYAAPWGPEELVELGLRAEPAVPRVRMELDRAGVAEVMNEALQQEIVLLELDPSALLTASLDRIKSACGLGWREDDPDPRHDCSTTALGQSFGSSGAGWSSSPEYALVRILTMTPANTVVDGTSLAGMRDLVDVQGRLFGLPYPLGSGFAQMLADSMGIPRTREVVPTSSVVHALRTEWIGSHPAARDGRIPITLRDALTDMATLGPRLGPVEVDGRLVHPGIVLGPTSSRIFTQDFRMVMLADSNLRWSDGIDLPARKSYLAAVVDTTGPSHGDLLEFDFLDPERFRIEGLVEAPQVDLSFAFRENPGFVSSCTGDGCQANLPETPVGPTSVWSTPRWQLEHIIAAAARHEYQDRHFDECYVPWGTDCFGRVAVGADGAPAGWLTMNIFAGWGNPPPPQYLWELVTEVSQTALHRIPAREIPEGEASVEFALEGVPVGLTADQIRAQVRPYLQAQASRISEALLGRQPAASERVDLFLRRGGDGRRYLFFAAPGEVRPGEPGHERPGFYADPELTPAGKLSRRDMPGAGDTEHEKLALVPGTTVVYVEDEAGQVYRLRLVVSEDAAAPVEVHVARRTGR
jgi:hypothetical protein